jgi:hypothetical protein
MNPLTGCTVPNSVTIYVNNITTQLYDTIGSGGSTVFNGVTRTTTGVYADTFPSVGGCDSIVYLNLRVLPTAVAGDAMCSPFSIPSTGIFHETSLRNLGVTNPDCDTIEGSTHYASSVPGEPMGSAAGATPVSGSASFAYTGSIASYTVPAGVTSLTIEAMGAQGASSAAGFVGGLGAKMKGDFSVTPGDQLLVLVGRAGLAAPSSAGGGGGSFVVKVDPTSTDVMASGAFAGLHVTPLVIAGGGGGLRTAATTNGNPGVSTTTATTASGTLSSGGGAVSATTPGNGGILSSSSWGSAGAGFRTNGAADGTFGTGGSSFLNGGAGGIGECSSGTGLYGGFGGGGSGGGCSGGGGGGGYTGGEGGWVAGGGGSYNAGSNQTNVDGFRAGNGSVTFAFGGTAQRTVWYNMTAPTCAASSVKFSTNTSPTSFDTRLTAYHRSTPSCTTGYVELASSNDESVAPIPTASAVTLTPGSGAASSSTYTPGAPIYVQVSVLAGLG